MTRDELLPLLQQRVVAVDATPLSAAALAALRALSTAADSALAETTVALSDARTAAEIRVLCARALRQLAHVALAAQIAQEPADVPPDRKQRHKARVARAQARALADHRVSPERPSLRPVETLSGVGETLGQALRARGVRTVGDLVWLLPTGYVDERRVTPLAELTAGQRQLSVGTVVSARPFGGGHTGRMAEV